MRRWGLWGVTISRRARRGASGVPATGSEVFARRGLSRSGPNAGLALSDAFGIYGAQKHTDKLNPENWTKKDLEEAVALVERLFGMLRSIPGLSRAARDEVNDAADRKMRARRTRIMGWRRERICVSDNARLASNETSPCS